LKPDGDVYRLLPCPNPEAIWLYYEDSYYCLEQVLQGTNYGTWALPENLDSPYMPNSFEVWIDQSIVADLNNAMFGASQTANLPSWLASVRQQLLWGSLFNLCCNFLDEASNFRPISHRIADFIKFVELVRDPEYYGDSGENHTRNFLNERRETWKKLSGISVSLSKRLIERSRNCSVAFNIIFYL
jgi:hypothetical protein